MPRTWWALALAFAVAVVAPHARAQSRSEETPVPRVVLPNGLVVLLSEDHKAPVVGLELRYAVGSRDDPPNRPGLAALTQRLMVQATKHVGPGEYERALDGAAAWDSAFSTSLDRSTFRITLPSDRFALPLWLWSDQMGFFVERLDEKLLAEQIAVVLNEHAQKIDGAPAGRLHDFVDAALYPPGHPYHGGWLRGSSELGAVTVAEVRAFFEAHYRPDQAILAITGDFESVRALSTVHRYFAAIGTSGAPAKARGARPRLEKETRLYVAAHVELPMVMVAWPTAPFYAPGDAELDLVAQVLSGHRAGWLRWKLVDELKIASNVNAHQSSRELGSEFMIEATAARGHTPDEMLDAMDRVIAKLQGKPPEPYSMHGAVAGYLVERTFAIEQSGSRADRLAECEQYGVGLLASGAGPSNAAAQAPCIETWLSRYASIEPSALTAAAQRELPLAQRVVAEVFPAEEAPIGGELRDVPPRAR
jgi:predicted Zn-dependent peptidase